jgi:hypothetical protein
MPDQQLSDAEELKLNSNALRGKIVEKCGTLQHFSDLVGISEAVVSSRISGKSDWKRKEILKASKILGIEDRWDEIGRLFFAKES